MLVYPGFTALDLVGPHMVFAMLGNADVNLVWKRKEVLTCEPALPIQATTTFDECPRDVDVLFVPGGIDGTFAQMNDDETLTFLADRGSRARWVTSVCTGSLVLGAAGLLRGYRAGCHWNFRDLLPLLGVKPVDERVVEDRNRLTGGGITAGIDLGLTLGARLRGEAFARAQELTMEYDPQRSVPGPRRWRARTSPRRRAARRLRCTTWRARQRFGHSSDSLGSAGVATSLAVPVNALRPCGPQV